MKADPLIKVGKPLKLAELPVPETPTHRVALDVRQIQVAALPFQKV
jgi:hypothetical protein